MMQLTTPDIWFVCGSQHLYGPGPLEQVAQHAQRIAAALSDNTGLPLKTVYRPIVKTSEDVFDVCAKANNDPNCVGLILWCTRSRRPRCGSTV